MDLAYRLMEFVETKRFMRHRSGRMNDDEQRTMETTLNNNPTSGSLERDTGGFRKLRNRYERTRKERKYSGDLLLRSEVRPDSSLGSFRKGRERQPDTIGEERNENSGHRAEIKTVDSITTKCVGAT